MPASSDSAGRSSASDGPAQRSRSVAPLMAVLACAVILLGLALSPAGAAATRSSQDLVTPTVAPGTGSIAGQAWMDTDADGILEAGEPPLAGLLVTAKSNAAGVSVSATSGADGNYLIAGLAPGFYQVSATPAEGYELTTPGTEPILVVASATVTINFGVRLLPTVTPTPTLPPLLDVESAEPLTCGGVYSGATETGKNNVSIYGCRPWWDESGKEKVYRLELGVRQPVTVTVLNASADLDLFMPRYALPDSCVAAGDNYLSYSADSGPYFLSVDGYRGAAGSYTFRVDCPAETQATPTPTYTPSATPTNTPTSTPGPTLTPSPTQPLRRAYLPMIWRSTATPSTPPVTFVLQEGLNGYTGTTDTTLSNWEPTSPHGDEKVLHLFHDRSALVRSPMEPLLRFDLSLLPNAATVEKAVLRLYVMAPPLYDLRGRVVGVLKPWDEQTATWEVASTGMPWTSPGATAVGGDRTEWASEAQQFVEGARWYEFDVTSLVREWAATRLQNYGMLLEALPGDSNANVEVRFVSREGATESRPQLVISYTLPAALRGQ